MTRYKITEILSNSVNDLVRLDHHTPRRGQLAQKEFLVFNNYELKISGEKSGLLILSTSDFNSIPIKHISRVVNTLFLVYGTDDNGRGKFNDSDIHELSMGGGMWKGRSWLHSEYYSQPAMIHCDEVEGLKLLIMNV